MEGAGGAQGHRPVAGEVRAHVPRGLARGQEPRRRAADGEGAGGRTRSSRRAECRGCPHDEAGTVCDGGD